MSTRKKYRIFYWIIFGIVILGFIPVIIYFTHFCGPLSDDASDWSAFAGLLSTTAAFIGFAGVIYTIIEGRKDAEKRIEEREEEFKEREKKFTHTEERANFYELLNIFFLQRDNVKYTEDNGAASEVTGINAMGLMANDARDLIESYLFLRNNAEEWDNSTSDTHTLLSDVRGTTRVSISWILPYENSWIELKDSLQKLINNNVAEINEGESELIWHSVIQLNGCSKRLGLPIPDLFQGINKYPEEEVCYVFKNVADIIYSKYSHYIGPYYRTIFYILQELSDYANKKRYSPIFRAQLSSLELPLLFVNSFGSQANKKSKTLEMYIKNELFNNMRLTDICKLSDTTEAFQQDYLMHLLKHRLAMHAK